MSRPPNLFDLAPSGPTVVSVGTFDGVHRGHQRLLHVLRERATRRQAATAVVTFDPPPRMILRPDPEYRLLCSLPERVDLLRQHGADRVALVSFDREVALMTAEAFSKQLCQRLGMVELVGGPDLALGHRREGTPEVLSAIGSRLGFDVTLVEQLTGGDMPVRSFEIRRLLREGRVEVVSELLGRHYALGGKVVQGDRRGRTIGVPTANLDIDEIRLIPADGVYAARALAAERWYDGVVNIGMRPTVGGTRRTVEVHLLDTELDLYGTDVQVELVARLREERRFPSLEDLVGQIRRDIVDARKVLAAG